MFRKVPILGDMLLRNAAKKEVVQELRTNPFAGYGLYHLMKDAAMLTQSALAELEPLINSVEQRLDMDDEELKISLPLQFDPLTDEEQDTLTYVIACALHEFGVNFKNISPRLRRAEIAGILDLLERHKDHTAPIHFEIDLEDFLVPVITNCGERVRLENLISRSGGIYMIVRKADQTSRYFPTEYLKQRRLNKGEAVRVNLIIKRGYLQVERFNHRCFYTKRWHLYTMAHKLPKDNRKAVVHNQEGEFYSLPTIYREPIANLIDLYLYNMQDKSYDRGQYQPRYE